MEAYTLSQSEDESRELFGGSCIISTKAGLRKATNEDAVGYSVYSDGSFRISVADGHWGREAAATCVQYWINNSPTSNPFESMVRLEDTLAERFAVASPDAELTQTPEASTLTVTVGADQRMDIVGYGDCRMSVLRDGQVVYRYKPLASWIGLFSSIGLRDRVPAKKGTYAHSIKLLEEDVVLLYTDGVDECVYEVPTLNVESLAAKSAAPLEIHDLIMEAVFKNGAEDNATVVIYRAPGAISLPE